MATLTDDQISVCERHLAAFLGEHPSITNRKLRALTGISYDQAITFFNQMVESGRLVRVGKGSTTRYETPKTKK